MTMSQKPTKPTNKEKATADRRVANDTAFAEFKKSDPIHESRNFVMNSFKPPSKPKPQESEKDGEK
ncbi:MAG: hypothetical protein CL536_01660 [Alcaligenaceae bacterium]|nr:hypothetical protein [Alcaligenaceae bacterium]